MAERRRPRRTAADQEPPDEQAAGEGDEPRDRRGRQRRLVKENPEPTEDELEPSDEDLEPAEDELEPSDEDLEPAREAPNGDRRRTGGKHGSVLTAKQAAGSALRQIAELTSRQPESITDVQRTDDGGWKIGVEVVEDRRIPSSADILATYEATIDADGELMS
jgi:hypothetical protein